MDSRLLRAVILALLLLQVTAPLSRATRLWSFASTSSCNSTAATAAPLLTKCPSTPTSNCSFYFASSPTSIPTFNLTAKQGTDQVLGGDVTFNSSTINLTTISNAGQGLPTAFVLWNSKASNGTTGNQFYGTGKSILARTFNQPCLSAFFTKNSSLTCVLLPITNAQLQNGSKVVNLNPGQVPEIPVASRCIVFKISK